MASHKTQIVMTTPKTKTTKKTPSKKSLMAPLTNEELFNMRLDGLTRATGELYELSDTLSDRITMTINIIGGIACASLLIGVGLLATTIIRLF
jgi:hypothetical protein